MGDDFVSAGRRPLVGRDPGVARRGDRAQRRDQGRVRRAPTSSRRPGPGRCSTTATRSRTRSRPRRATRCCTARRWRSGSCSPAQLAGTLERIDQHVGRAPRVPRRRPRAPHPGAARLAGRRDRPDHGPRQEVGRWPHVHARGAERNRTGRRSRPGRGAQGARGDRYRGIGRTWRRSCCSRDRT